MNERTRRWRDLVAGQEGKPLNDARETGPRRIARIDHQGELRLAAVEEYSLAIIDRRVGGDEADPMAIPRPRLLELIDEALARGERVDLASAALLPAVACPSKIIAIGLNYADHIEESGLEMPEVPTVFAKFPNALNGPRGPIERPRISDTLDYEGELALVIGERCRHVGREDAPKVIGGYTVLDDVSVRAVQMQTPQWSLGKSFDTHAPIGPWITVSGVDPHDLRIETRVNGELRQESSTSNLVFDCYDLVAYLSQVCTLNPGDVVATGTPAGVGAAMDPPRYLAPGDVVTVEIEGLGRLENAVVDEREDEVRAVDSRPGKSPAAR